MTRWVPVLALAALASTGNASAACSRTITADVVAIDQPLMFNRLGATNVNGMMYALKRDVVASSSGSPGPGNATLRLDKRPRPLVLRVAAGDCLTVNFENWLSPSANPHNGHLPEMTVNDQVTDRYAGFHAQGMQLVGGMQDDSSYVGKNTDSMVAPGGSAVYRWYAEHEGTFLVTSYGASFGGEGAAGNSANGLFAAINVEPRDAKFYRSQLTEEEMRLATKGTTPQDQPILDYDARYPAANPDGSPSVWAAEGKAGLPILNMLDGNQLVHSDLNAVITGPNPDGSFPPTTYPLESIGKRNPTLPNRLEAFREFTVVFHDEMAVANAFPKFYERKPGNPLGYTLHALGDVFMVNYGSGGVGSEVIANRLGVGPMHDCLDCVGEEFFLTSHAVGDPAMVVDIPANVGLETLAPGDVPAPGTTGPKATMAYYPDDPSNVHHSYTNDFVKFRNLHTGKEHHVFHLHNHQWLYNPNDDNANYLDAQAVGPGSGYTYEINFGGSGNRNKSAGDAIFHCHLYPHFAQGMWELWRNHDVLETGTPLEVSGSGFHTGAFDLLQGKPAANAPDARARALPDGEILAGTPIPAVVPLPGKALPPMPGKVEIVANKNTVTVERPDANGALQPQPIPVGSVARMARDRLDPTSAEGQALAAGPNTPTLNKDLIKNPGFPFWVAGIEDTVGQRPPTPPLDMAPRGADPKDGGWDGGLPRHTLDGISAAGGALAGAFTANTNRLDLTKEVHKAKAVWFPEEGTDIEKVAMAFHAIRKHPSVKVSMDGSTAPADFVTNGSGGPKPGSPFHDPCIDDTGVPVTAGGSPRFFNGVIGGTAAMGPVQFGADNPRIYKGANIQFDAVLNKAGWHYPQERIIALWDDALPIINKQKPPEPLVMRNNTLDCTVYLHTNLVPKVYELDDYQVRTTTDIIGQHIHLPKWDLTTTDGSANGWNYEDGTLAPDAVVERIDAINALNPAGTGNPSDSAGRAADTPLVAEVHPYFNQKPEWRGARTTLQRWFFDPVVNVGGVHRGLGIIFTHDHFGPSTHQQVGLYGTVLVEPAGSRWVHNETGQPLYDGVRKDGGPTSWQAAIITGDVDNDGQNDSYREFYLEYTDFQHAYQPGVYIGRDEFGGLARTPDANSYKSAINPPYKSDIAQTDPLNLVGYAELCPDGSPRPCPEGITADDPGTMVVNYRNEPLGLRIYDPSKTGPDGQAGAQADGLAGDLAYALQSRTDRKLAMMNQQPVAGLNAGVAGTRFPPPLHPRPAVVRPGDPFTPMLRAYYGDRIRIKIQAGGDEETHNASIHGTKWLQGGSGFGFDPMSGWRNSQQAAISEQFTFASPILPLLGNNLDSEKRSDYLYSTDSSTEGYWNGTWGLLRNYGKGARPDLYQLPNNPQVSGPMTITNKSEFSGVCPLTAATRNYDLSVVLANDVLGNSVGATIPASTSAGSPLNPNGGTLVFNPRGSAYKGGVLHDPTAMMYVLTSDLAPKPGIDALSSPGCFSPATAKKPAAFNPTLMTCPASAMKLKDNAPVEPLVMRAAAGECVTVTLRNRLGRADAPDANNFRQWPAIVPRSMSASSMVTTLNGNLVRPSATVGLHSALVAYDITNSDGSVVGLNGANKTLADPLDNPLTATDERVEKYKWYAGDLSLLPAAAAGQYRLVATPVEFGGINLMPTDKIEQGQKSLIGALVIEPQGSTWTETETVPDHQGSAPAATRLTRASALVTTPVGTKFKDFVTVLQKGLNQYHKDGTPVEGIAAESVLSEDAEDAGQMALNYGSEPLWFRFGLAPNLPFVGGDPAHPGAAFGDVADAHTAYSNERSGSADPATPVFKVKPGQEFRMHVLEPTGTARASVFNLHGHDWQRAPYVCPGSASQGLAGNCKPTGFFPTMAGFEVGSRAIGDSPLSNYLGGQDSLLPASHLDIRIPSAGGAGAVPGDYLFRDQASFGNLGGLWGIIRVE
ncbi:MAG: hypothetical protein FIA97_05925 [Methylococcaceae bacterium]|nr:hypothetical protein [Methylococcaceae bacterium]